MPTYPDSLIKLIDERIRLLIGGGEGGNLDQQLPIAAPGVMGTVVDRSPGPLVLSGGLDTWPDQHMIAVLVDGGGSQVDALCFSNVRARPNDRVGLAKFGAHWVVTGTFGPAGLGASNHFPLYGIPPTALPAIGTGSATYVVMTGTPTLTFVKEHDYTDIAVDLRISGFCNSTAHEVRYGVRFTDLNGSTVDSFDMANHVYSVVDHTPISGTRVLHEPAGTWLVQLIWKRIAGAVNNVSTGTSDWVSFTVQEVIST